MISAGSNRIIIKKSTIRKCVKLVAKYSAGKSKLSLGELDTALDELIVPHLCQLPAHTPAADINAAHREFILGVLKQAGQVNYKKNLPRLRDPEELLGRGLLIFDKNSPSLQEATKLQNQCVNFTQLQLQNTIRSLKKTRVKLIIGIVIDVGCIFFGIGCLLSGATTGLLIPPAIASITSTVSQLVTDFKDLREKNKLLAQEKQLNSDYATALQDAKALKTSPDSKDRKQLQTKAENSESSADTATKNFFASSNKQEKTSSYFSMIFVAMGVMATIGSGIINTIFNLPQMVSVIGSWLTLGGTLGLSVAPAYARARRASKHSTNNTAAIPTHDEQAQENTTQKPTIEFYEKRTKLVQGRTVALQDHKPNEQEQISSTADIPARYPSTQENQISSTGERLALPPADAAGTAKPEI